jgi:hypothetical protein
MAARRETGFFSADWFGVLDAMAFDGESNTARLILLWPVRETDSEVCRFAVFGDSADRNEENVAGAVGLGGITGGKAVGEPFDLSCFPR